MMAALRAEPELRRRLRNQLAMGELTSRVLSAPRRHFIDGVNYRLQHLGSSGRFVGGVISSVRRKSAGQRRMPLRMPMALAMAAAAAIAVMLIAPWNATKAAAVLESASHASVRRADGNVVPAVAGMPLRFGDTVTRLVEGASSVTVVRADGARLTAGYGAEFALADLTRVQLTKGALHVDVPHASGAPVERLVVATAGADVHVTGTRFRVATENERTYLAMHDGMVRFANQHGEILVFAPQRARADAGSAPEFDVRPLPRQIQIEFHHPSFPVATTAKLDSGEEYSVERGYGWAKPNVVARVSGARNQGWTGRSTLEDEPGRGLYTASSLRTEIWMIDVPDGRYRVTVRVGDIAFAQGPHHVRVQDEQVIDQVMTAPGEYVERSAIVTVLGGRLLMSVGGGGGQQTAADGTTDTTIMGISIEPAP
jgi:hypothetical protein